MAISDICLLFISWGIWGIFLLIFIYVALMFLGMYFDNDDNDKL